MFRTILELLTKALGRNHPVVQKMARSVERGDPKVTSIPTQTKLPNIALKDLDIERANSEQIKTAPRPRRDLSAISNMSSLFEPLARRNNLLGD